MPLDRKTDFGSDLIAQRTTLQFPATGMEAEFNVWVNDLEVVPEKYWAHPKDFIDCDLLTRTSKSSQLPTGGAVYFDKGVIEVVTPVIELTEGCTARVVRSLWEQIDYVRGQLTGWEKETGNHVRLKAYSSHYNVSFELKRRELTRDRNIKKLALLLAYILPVPMMLIAANRRSTGVGVRPRGNRIEITSDFTPDPGLMIAAATLIVGIVREVISWPSYDLSLLETLPIPVVAGVIPGKHTTRKGWLTKDFHYPQSPYTCDINAPIWTDQHGRKLSLRQMGWESARFFKRSIRKHSDPFSFRLLFAVLEGLAPSLLELTDRPAAYEDVGRLCSWGTVIHELKSYETEMSLLPARDAIWNSGTIDEYIAARERERARQRIEQREVSTSPDSDEIEDDLEKLLDVKALSARKGISSNTGVRSRAAGPASRTRQTSPPGSRSRAVSRAELSRRTGDTPGRLLPPRPADYLDRRSQVEQAKLARDRRGGERRSRHFKTAFPDRRLTRSAYEQVFLKLVSGGRLKIDRDTWTPVGMKGWYHAIFRRDSDGTERLITIDQLLRKMNDWM